MGAAETVCEVLRSISEGERSPLGYAAPTVLVIMNECIIQLGLILE
jgi:hypothetical protein